MWLFSTVVFGSFAFLAGFWLGWQLLRQNGRILLRLDELEQRLNELEFGEGEQPEGLPLGNEAPAFELPDLAGERQSLAQFRGQPVLLIFLNPDCGFCREMMPKLAALSTRSRRGNEAELASETGVRLLTSAATSDVPFVLLLLSTSDAEKNRQLFAEHKVGYPVLLQNDGEVAKAYQAHGTPSGYLVSAQGKIASPLAMGAEALLELASQPASEPPLGEREKNGDSGDARASRFSQRSVARSKIKRDGLKAGTPAPDFRLPRLDGRGDLTLSELRGKPVLLVFSSPGCGPCNALAPELEKFHRQQLERDGFPVAAGTLTPSLSPSDGERVAEGRVRGTSPITVVMISKGEPQENRAKVKEHGLTFPVVLQQQWEISRRYAMFATPIAYLIDEGGIIAHDVAVGVESIRALIAAADAPQASARISFALPSVASS